MTRTKFEKLYTDNLKDHTTDLNVVQDRIKDTTDELEDAIEDIEVALVSEAEIAVTFNDVWTNYGSGHSEVTYYKDVLGTVHISGTADSNGSIDGNVFTLPAGYRPGAYVIYMCASSNASENEVRVSADGAVDVLNALPATYMSFDGITFRAVQ